MLWGNGLGRWKSRHGIDEAHYLRAKRLVVIKQFEIYFNGAESHLTRQLFAGMLRKITMLPSPAG